MKNSLVWAKIHNTEWAILPDALEAICEIAARQTDIDALESKLGRPLENTESAYTRGSTAIIPIIGPTIPRANMFSRISGATSYEVIARDLREAVDNPSVSSIVLNIDSPGGAALGVAELATHIFEARKSKKVVAYVGAKAASAAYWLASAAGEVVINRTAMLGSIGAVVGFDKKSDDDIRGEIVSSQSPYKRIDPTTEQGKARVQAMVDNLAALFIDDVAEFRNVSVDKVMSDFGQGDMLIGKAAVDAGMADSLGSLEGLLARLADESEAGMSGTIDPYAGQPTSTNEAITMDIKTLRKDHPDLVAQIEQEAIASVETPDVAAAEKAAATAERDRVLAILGHDEAKGREGLAQRLAAKDGMTAEDAADILASAPAAATLSSFEAEMASQNPDIKPDPEAGAEGGDSTESYLARSAKLGQEYGIE